jgi:ABC-type multidrug transport system fused ATPase/permease subunit
VAEILAAADGRRDDAGLTTAVCEVTSPDPGDQLAGVERLATLLPHPEYGAAARSILESFVTEAGGGPGGQLSMAAARRAAELLASPAAMPPEAAGGRPPLPRSAMSAAPRSGSALAAMVRHGLRRQPGRLTVALIGSVSVGLAAVAIAVALAEAARRLSESDGSDPGPFAAIAALVLALGMLRGVCVYAVHVCIGGVQVGLATADRQKIVRANLRSPYARVREQADDAGLALVDADRERAWHPMASLPFVVGTAAAMLAAIATLAASDPAVGAVGAAMFGFLVTGSGLYIRTLTPFAARARALAKDVHAAARDGVDAAVLAATVAGPERARDFAAASDALRDARLKLDAVRRRYTLALDIAPVLGALAVIGVVVWRDLSGPAGVTVVVTAVLLFGFMALPVRAMAWFAYSLPGSAAGWLRAQPTHARGDELTYGQATLARDRGLGPLRFHGVSLDAADGRPAVRDASFEVMPGRIVAVTGTVDSAAAIGALAARLIDPRAGTISVNGTDLRELSEDALGRQIVWTTGDAAQLRDAAADAGARLLVVDCAGLTLTAVEGAALVAALRAAPAPSAMVVTHHRSVLMGADEVLFVENGRVHRPETHERLLQAVPEYAELVTVIDDDEAGEDDSAACADPADDGPSELDTDTDHLAILAGAPSHAAGLRRFGATCPWNPRRNHTADRTGSGQVDTPGREHHQDALNKEVAAA